MDTLFSAGEILSFAVNVEENGREFYEMIAKKVKKDELKKIFLHLANEEHKHKEKFEEFLLDLDAFKPEENYPQSYFSYLKAYSDNIIFGKKNKGKIKAEDISSAEEAVDFGIQIEQDSIHYYLEVKEMVPETQKKIIEKIINEERKHYILLVSARKILSGVKE
jgi:rubrerythrin